MGNLKYDDTRLDEESLKVIREELKETEEKREICLGILKKKLTDTNDLNPNLNDGFLMAYLRVSKFDCHKAYQRILKYYDDRLKYPGIFHDYSPSSVKIAEVARQIYACPYRMKDHSALFILKRGVYDPSKVHYHVILRALCMAGDLVTLHPLTQMCGATIIIDLSQSSWGAWTEYTPSNLKLIASVVQKSSAVRIRMVHIINAPSIYYLLYSIISPFLSTKMRSRVIIHKNLENLHSCIEAENLTEEYGGSLKKSDLINVFEKMYKMEEFFQKYSKYGFTKHI